MSNQESGPFTLPDGAHIGRTAVRVGELEAVLPFYRDALGFRVDRDGDTARLTAGADPLVQLLEDPSAPDRTREQAGLFHVAIRVPARTHLANALARLRTAGASLTGAADHGVSEALYLRDPEGNGVEIYRDRAKSEWTETDDGRVEMGTDTLALDALSAVGDDDPGQYLPEGADIGHVHLEVVDLDAAETFYSDVLGMNVRARYGESATFLAAGDYHHHVGLNTWNHRMAPATDSRGLAWYEVVVPDTETLASLRTRLEEQGTPTKERETGIQFTDPDGVELRVSART